jgi:hypothetical protein
VWIVQICDYMDVRLCVKFYSLENR